MLIYHLMLLILILGGVSMVYNKKFLLSVMISLEFLLLKSIALIMYTSLMKKDPRFTHLSMFVLALSAIEASLGMSLMALMSRNILEVSIIRLKTLKS